MSTSGAGEAAYGCWRMRVILDVLLITVLNAYWWVILAAAVFSWLVAFNVVNMRNQVVHSIGDVLYRLTEPVFAPVRRRLPAMQGLDLSPIVVLIAMMIIQGLYVVYIRAYIP